MNFCMECGKQLQDNARFCKYCGAKVQAPPQPAVPEPPEFAPEAFAGMPDIPAPQPKKKSPALLIALPIAVLAAAGIVATLLLYMHAQKQPAAEEEIHTTAAQTSAAVQTAVPLKLNFRGDLSGFIWPSDGPVILRPYGVGVHEFSWGIAITGTLIAAAKEGDVELVQRDSKGDSTQVIINHGGGVRTIYAHMRSNSILVSQGQHVSARQKIGNTGAVDASDDLYSFIEELLPDLGADSVADVPYVYFMFTIDNHPLNPLEFIRR